MAPTSRYCFLNDEGVMGKIALTEGPNNETNLVVYCDKVPGGSMTIENVGISRQCGPFEYSSDDIMPLPSKFRGFDYCPIYVDGNNHVWLIDMIPAMDSETMSAFRLELRKNVHGFWRLYIVEAGYYQKVSSSWNETDIKLDFDFRNGTCSSKVFLVEANPQTLFTKRKGIMMEPRRWHHSSNRPLLVHLRANEHDNGSITEPRRKWIRWLCGVPLPCRPRRQV